MQKRLLIDASHREETRIVLLDDDQVEEFDFESGKKKQLAGNIFLAKVTRVEPSLQAAFLDYGGNRHGFLAFSEIHPDYYQIPVADREALLAEEQDIDTGSEDFLEQEFSGEVTEGNLRSYTEIKDTVDETITSEPLNVEKDSDLETTPIHEISNNEESFGNQLNINTTNEDVSADLREVSPETDPNIKEKGPTLINQSNPKKRPRKNRYKIQEVIKVRQVLLIQVVKDERGNKGAALTTYMSLAGRYCVLMPNTARGGGISRKITNIGDRKKLKETASQFSIPDKMGLIIRTAGAKRTKTEIKRDFEYLLRQWEQIRDLTLKSIAPCPIYEEGSVIKRSIRDLYTKEINEILVEGETGFKEAKDYMKMLMPSHAKKIKYYEKTQPIFSFYGVENYLSGMFNPTVQLKSGGYIVIGITEALVAIDVNSGRATKESGIEATALRTNLEAANEIARQLRMRDLAGLIVIDFIDMEEKKNNNSVERKLRDSLKLDRARIQVGRISSFGLLEMSRQRLRYGMVEATTQPCPNCHGTGLTRSNENLALAILRALENKKTQSGIKEAIVKAPVEVANYLLNQKRNHLSTIEMRLKTNIFIHADINIQNPNFVLELNKSPGTPDDPPLGKVITIDGSKPGIQEGTDPINETESTSKSVQKNVSENTGKKPKRRRRRNNKNRLFEGEPAFEAELISEKNEPALLKEVNTQEESKEKNTSPKEPSKPVRRKSLKNEKANYSGNPSPRKRVRKNAVAKVDKNESAESNVLTETLIATTSASDTDDKKLHGTANSFKSVDQGPTKQQTKKRVAKPVKEVLKKNVTKSNNSKIKQSENSEEKSRTGWWSRKNPRESK